MCARGCQYIFGEGIAATISLDSADVNEVVYLYLEHSFRKLGWRSELADVSS